MKTNEQATLPKGGRTVQLHRKAAVIVGALFILAAITSILGLIWYQPIVTGDYLINGVEHRNQVILGAFMELLLVCSAIGTAIGMFPVLRRVNERIALAHLCFRFLEAVVITVGIVAVLSLLTLSQAFVALASGDPSAFRAAGIALLAVHDWTFLLGPNFMLGINTLMYSFLFFRSGLVPRPLAVLGMAGATLVFTAAMLELFGVIAQISLWGALLCTPVALYEMSLAVWLIVRGFNASVLVPEPPAPGMKLATAWSD